MEKVKSMAAWFDRKWISLAVLVFVNLINYADRYTISAVLDGAMNELCDSDLEDGVEERCTEAQGGLIPSMFIVFYFAGAPIFGYLGDRYSRKIIMTVGIVVWGGFSLATSFMPHYWGFLIVRAMYAFGESAFTTIAPVVLGDLFTDDTRSLVYGIFYMAIPLGSGLGFVLGGAPADWRMGLRITPGLTFFAAFLVFALLYDPPRGESEGKEESALEHTSYWEDVKYILTIKSFMLNAVGFTCVTFTTGALAFYAPLYFVNAIDSMGPNCTNVTTGAGAEYEPVISTDAVSFVIGAITATAGLGGVVAGMLLSRNLRGRFEWIDPFICGTSLIVSIPLLIVAIQLAKSNTISAFIIMFFGMFFLNFNWSVAVDMTIYVITPTRRASAEAIHLMLTHALGEAGAPYMVGLLVDGLKEGVKEQHAEGTCRQVIDYYSFQYAMYLPIALLFLGGLLFLLACRWVVRDKQAVEKETRDL